jgi:hypothetical protein
MMGSIAFVDGCVSLTSSKPNVILEEQGSTPLQASSLCLGVSLAA